MNLHEYQAKQLFARYGLPVPKGVLVRNASEARQAIQQLNTEKWVVKAQIHAGGRGKAGGVKLVDNEEQLEEAVRLLLHRNLITYQTDEKGQPVNEVLVEETCEIERELYLSVVVDRASKRVVLMASTEGGVDIEKVAQDSPEKIIKVMIDPLMGVLPYQARELAVSLKLNTNQSKQLAAIMAGLGKMFMQCDLSLLEINPLVMTKAGNLLCLDGKVTIDDNALYRQDELRNMRDSTQENALELRAREWELNYIALDGDIGCMVNGAGLAMATMDIIKLHGGNPANFLDVGGGATEERVREAFKIILSEPNVKAILVNIFGGIVRCDLIAEGIMAAVAEVGIKVPVVVRLEGNRALEASELLAKSGLNIIPAKSLTHAAECVVQEARNPL